MLKIGLGSVGSKLAAEMGIYLIRNIFRINRNAPELVIVIISEIKEPMKKPCIEVRTHQKLYRLHPQDISKLSRVVMPCTPPLPAWSECISLPKEDFRPTIDQWPEPKSHMCVQSEP